jgi:glycine/serine hydroxymethyltransferase
LLAVCSTTGTPALTSRGFTEDDFEKVAEYFDRAVEIAVKVKGATGKGPVIKIGDSCFGFCNRFVTMEKFL